MPYIVLFCAISERGECGNFCIILESPGGRPFSMSGGTRIPRRDLKFQPRATLLNLSAERGGSRGFRLVIGDGRAIPFRDGSFDVVFSNSVIEHLRDFESQCAFAAEIARVGKRYWVQTPNRWFFIEPHLLAPFIHFLPASWRKRLLRSFTVWGILTRPSTEYCEEFVREVRLLSAGEMRALFAGATIVREKVLGVTKSLIAVSPSRNVPLPARRSSAEPA